MLMTQTEMNSFLSQINQAFKDQFNKVDLLEKRVETLEAQLNEQKPKPKTKTNRTRR